MRDAILDRIFQPAINRLHIAPRPIAMELASAFCALELVAQARVAIVNVDVVGPAISAVVAVVLMRALRTSARHGSSLLTTSYGLIHMLARVALLAISMCNLGTMMLVCCIAGPAASGYDYVDVATTLASLAAAISLYVGVCDQPPRRRRSLNAFA